MLSVAILLHCSISVCAEELELKDEVSSAAVLLQDILKEQYSDIENEIKVEAERKGYDLVLTKETYKDQGNPYKDFDFTDFIATYAALSDYCEENKTINPVRINRTSFISYSIKEEKAEGNRPVKVGEYEKHGDYYVETGYRYSEKTEVIATYEETDETDISGNMLLKKTGEERIIPEKEEIKYGVVDLKVLSPRDILKIADIDEKKIEKDIENRKKIIENSVNNDDLSSSVFLKFPDLSVDSETWKSIFYQNICLMTDTAAPSSSALVCAAAESLMGKVPYEWGGKPVKSGYDTSWWTYDFLRKEQKGLDCSGFVKWAYMTAGYNDQITGEMASTNTILGSDFERISESDLEPGDIGVIKRTTTNHCGIYAGNGEWYHCSSDKDTIVKTAYNFNEFFRPAVFNTELPEEVIAAGASALEQEENTINITPVGGTQNANYSDNDVMTLAKLMTHEAGSEGLNGWIAVGEVVRNRILSPLFPNSVERVTFQQGQFSSVGRITGITPRPEVIEAARNVLYGGLSILNNPNVLYFRNPKTTSGISATANVNWGSHKYYGAVGHHAFYFQ